jgi:hypothetical protein
VFEDAHLLLDLQISLFGVRQFGDKAVVADPVARSQVTVGARTASGSIDEVSQVFVALKEVAMHTRSSDDDLSADPSIFSLQLIECLQYRGALGRRIAAPAVCQA